jgi:hypothetical protein
MLVIFILCIFLLNFIAIASSNTVTTTAYYTCNACVRITPGYSCPSSCPYLAKCASPQETSCSQTSSTTSTTTTSTSTTTINYCSVDTASAGQCDFSNTIMATTPASYYSAAGNGQLTPQQEGGVQTTPVTKNVISYDSGNPQWLITCPNTPNPANSWEYIVSSQSSPAIGGDECLASNAPVNTLDTGNLYVSWGPTTQASANLQADQQGGQISISNLAYAGEAYNSVSGLSSANTSNGYDTFTNVFSPIPSDQQSGIWTWNAKLGGPSALSYSWQEVQSFNSLLVTKTVNNEACQYNYDYSVASNINSIKSYSKVPVPIAPTPTTNYLSFNNQTYPDFQIGSQYGANAIAMSECYLPDLLDAWHLVGYNGILDYQGNTESNLCVYQYSNIPEYWAAYSTPSGKKTGFVPSNSLTFENFPYMPYFLYNLSIPISSGSLFNNGLSYLNESYYVYSPHNIQSPGNFIDPIMIGGGNMSGSTSGIFMSANGVLTQLSYSGFIGSDTTPIVPGTNTYNGLQVQSKSFIIAANYIVANNQFGLVNAEPIGNSYSVSNITNASYLAPSASNYMFVSSSNPACQTAGECSYKTSYLYGITLVPKGYFNPTLYPPSNFIAEEEASSSSPNLQKAVSAYWYNVSSIQSSTGYVTKMYNLTNLTSGFYPWLNYCNQQSSQCSQTNCNLYGQLQYCFTPPPEYTLPIAITSDNEGDVFVMTANVVEQTSTQTSPGSGFNLLAISSNGIIATTAVVDGQYASQFGQDVAPISSAGNGYPASMAASPDGKYLYVSERGMPMVLIYHLIYYGNTLKASYSGAINLAYNNASSGYNLSITDYLQGGGPFNSSLLKQAYSSPSSQISDLGSSDNNQIKHVPLGIADSGGVLYVLDEWLFNADSCNLCGGHAASDVMLMLRAFTYNGTEIPIHPTTYQDMFNPNGASLSTGYYGAYTNPPYGWPLAANFSVWYQSGQTSAKYLSYCSFGCTYSSTNPPQEAQNFGGFPPDGPFIGAEWATPLGTGSTSNPDILPPEFSISSDFNNTIYLDEGSYTSPTPHTSNLCYTYSNFFGGTYDPPNCVNNFYNEIAALHFNPYNYTRIASTPTVSATCYIGINKTWEAAVSSMPSWASTLSNTPCQSIADLASQTLPFSGIPDAFTYAEGIGSPSLYTAAPISIPSTLSYSGNSQSAEPSVAAKPKLSFSSSSQQALPTLKLSPTTVIMGQNVIAQCTVSTGTCDIEEPLNQPLPTSILPAACSSSSSSGYTETCAFNSIDLGAGTFTFYSRSPGSLSYSSANLIVASSTSPIMSINPSVAVLGQSVNVIATCAVSTDTCVIEMPLGTPIQNSLAQATCSPSQAVNGNAEICSFNSNSLGTGSYTIYTKDISGEYAGDFVSASLLIIPPVTTVPSPPSEPGISFLKSSIYGSLLVPYSYSYALTQAWLPQVDNSLTNNAICIANPLDFGPPQASSGTAYGLSSAISANSVLNETIQSGLLLAQFENTKQYFIANLSDAGIIFPPQLYINIFDNRILGEVYINQSVSPKGLNYPTYPSTPTTVTNPGGTLEVFIANTPQASGTKDLITVQDYSFPSGSSSKYYMSLTIQDAATGKVISQTIVPGSKLSYTLCAAGNSCPYPGNYLLTGCGITNLLTGQQACINNVNLKVIPSKPISLVINASHSYNYSQENFIQTSSYGSFPGFSAENAIEQQPATFNALCSFCSSPGYYYNPSNLFSGNNIITYSSANSINFAQLFNQLKAQSYIYLVGLNLIYNPKILGYNRFNYTYIDEFNNTINMPLDVDLANITSISLNTVSSLSPTNTNETTIAVNGIAGYYPSAFSTNLSPLPANSPIYIYYDTNINFYTDALNPASDPAGYYAYAEQCAFGSTQGCALANPVLSSNIPYVGQGDLGPQLANVVTFNTQYNSIGQCPPQPTSLLTPSNTWECNIYGDFGLPQTGRSANGNIEYCVPDYANGTGVLTSQLGLIGIAKTNSAGAFGYTFTACGTGTARIQANYYGYPSPQPQVFYQPPLQQPESTGPSAELNPLIVPSIEFNYSIAPNSTYTSFALGTYYLSFGEITPFVLMAIAGAFVIYVIIRLNSNSKR